MGEEFDNYVPQTELGRKLYEAAKKARDDPNTRLLSMDEIAFDIAGLLPEYDAMHAALAASEQRCRELQARLQKLVVAWRNTEGVLTEQGAHQMAGGYYNCAEDLQDALTAPPSSAPSDDQADTGREA